jgi:hypothetical protein
LRKEGAMIRIEMSEAEAELLAEILARIIHKS